MHTINQLNRQFDAFGQPMRSAMLQGSVSTLATPHAQATSRDLEACEQLLAMLGCLYQGASLDLMPQRSGQQRPDRHSGKA